MKRPLLLVAVLAAPALLTPLADAAVAPPVFVVDLHVDLPYRVNYRGAGMARGSGQYVANELGRAGVAGIVLPLFVPKDVSAEGPRMRDLEDSYRKVIALIPKTSPYALPGCEAEEGRVRTWLAFEGAGPLAADPAHVDRWVTRGVRLFGLVHGFDNQLAGSSSTGTDRGLTPKGREVVRRVHAAGALVDVSHASDAATADVLELAKRDAVPVVATHSNARALHAHERNLTDDQIRAIAATGGIVGVNFHARFLTDRATATVEDVVRHVRHIAKVGGIDHVAIGSDFEGGIRPPRELADVRGFPRLSRALLEAGLSRDDVAKVFHRNALRVLCPAGKPRGAGQTSAGRH